MPPRLNFLSASRSLAIRSRPAPARVPVAFRIVTTRGYAKKKGPNEDNAPHVSEEAAQQAEIMGETKPDIDGQGTPVQEILERDDEAKKNAPKVIKEEMNGVEKSAAENMTFEEMLAMADMEDDDLLEGHKFGVPELPIASHLNKDHRYDPVVDQVTNLLMLHGKKSVAQRNMSYILNHLRTAPPPRIDPSKPLLPGAPPAHHLPLNPVLYLTLAIDSIAPLLRIRSQKGAAGGGASLAIPIPLSQRQRRRQAVQWILAAVDKKKSRGSGRGQFAQRVADEIVAVAEGRSSAWEKRMTIHKTGTAARSNLSFGQRRGPRL